MLRSTKISFSIIIGTLLYAAPAGAQGSGTVTALLKSDCIGCHNDRVQAGGIMLDRIDTSDVRVDADVWERILRRLRSRTMPPPGRTPRPDNATYESAIADIQTHLDKLAIPLRPADRITSTELASRMAKLLWGNSPDAPLLDAARHGDLRTNAGIERQVTRMIADPQSKKVAGDFIEKWLHLDWLERMYIDPEKWAQFPGSIQMDMQREAALFIDSQFREDHPITDLFTANYTFMNRSLAQIYDVPGVTNAQFARTSFPDERRAGLLGMAGVLTMTSVTIRTSATERARWLWLVFFGAPPPAPPPDLPPLAIFKTHRQLDAAYSEGSCRSCHFISQLASPLENFDELGRWRTTEMGEPVDSSGMLPDGTLVNGPVELRNGLMKFKDAFTMTMAERLMAYALGRGVYGRPVYWQEMPAVRAVVHNAAAKDYRWSAVLAGIIESSPFQAKRVLP